MSTHEYTDDEFSESDDDDDDDDVDTVPLWCPLAEREELHLSEQKLITLLSLYWMLRQMYQTKPRHITSDCTNPIDIFLKYLDIELLITFYISLINLYITIEESLLVFWV